MAPASPDRSLTVAVPINALLPSSLRTDRSITVVVLIEAFVPSGIPLPHGCGSDRAARSHRKWYGPCGTRVHPIWGSMGKLVCP